MASTQLPAMTFDGGADLRIVLVPTSDDGDTATASEPRQSFDLRDIADGPDHQPPNKIPTHPVPSMQDAFAESLHEVTTGGSNKIKLRALDAKARRERLIEQPADAEPFDATWRYRRGQQQHEMYKLIAQITFGVYLLLNGMAADNTQVVTILQGHIDEVDEFLEVMLEDFAQAHKDLTERIHLLQLPMANRHAFEQMLEDRNFRAQILSGNEKIDHILARTNAAMKQWDDDIDAGIRSSEAFMEWLNEQSKGSWSRETPDLESIFVAMRGNADGWLNAFDDLNNQAQDLNGLIIKLMTIIAEMEKTAGEVSRKTWASIPPFSLPLHAPEEDGSPTGSPHSRSTPRASIRSGGSASTLRKTKSLKSLEVDEDSMVDFPLPGAMPLLPPTRFSVRKSTASAAPRASKGPAPKEQSLERQEEEKPGEIDDGPLYILQPKTYTPQSTPLPSPMVKNVSSPPQDRNSTHPTPAVRIEIQSSTTPSPSLSEQGSGFQQKRTSLRQRVSLKTTPPESIHIPPRNAGERRSQRPSVGVQSPQTAKSQAHDSAYGSDNEHPPHGHRLPRAVSHADFSAPVRPPLMPSPRSEHQQYYHPVRASPHSPLQQRPHTAGHAEENRPSAYYPGHQRNQPSRMGGMSMLSNVTMATYDDRATVRSGATTTVGGKRVKKKKSAFGWLKKAFTLDEDEKAEYQARKAMQQMAPQPVYDARSPRFLDGKRVR